MNSSTKVYKLSKSIKKFPLRLPRRMTIKVFGWRFFQQFQVKRNKNVIVKSHEMLPDNLLPAICFYQ